MRSFKVSLNGKKLCLAGVGERGVLSAITSWEAGERGENLFIGVGGLADEEHTDWVRRKRLQVGDEVRVQIIETGSPDKPTRRRRNDPAETLKAKQNYVRNMAKELGWKIQTGNKRP
jgi:hypothetical protein